MSPRKMKQKAEGSQTQQKNTRGSRTNKISKRKLSSSADSESDLEVTEEEATHFVEESSESEPDTESENWDQDCITIPKFNSENRIQGYHLMPTCDRDPEIHPNKRQKLVAAIRESLVKENFMNKLQNVWNKNETFKQNGMEVIADPFKVCVIDNILENSEILHDVRQEFYEIDWNERNMDLYEFFQSKDLKHIDSGYIYMIYEFLKSTVLDWVSKFMNVELTNISATCSLYTNTDYLLVHDDQREDRLVAFVLYLTGEDGWSDEKGGALQLLASDEDGHPTHVVRDILPSNNQLVLFTVANNSHHQVAEVTTREDCRMSINGWFHTTVPPKYKNPVSKVPIDGLFSDNTIKMQNIDIDLHSWINEDYLMCTAFSPINKQIEEYSEICLKNFLKEEPFKEILQTLTTSTDLSWKRIGPPNKFCYDVLENKGLPHILERFLDLFQSREMFLLLHRYTDLELTTEKASMKFEFQRWQPGDYALLTDYKWEDHNELDLIIYFGVTNRSDVIGGRTQYVTLEDEIQTALITIEPEDNDLNIVYRDTARFTKYVSKQSRCKCFYTAIFSYCE